jgi:hypothetical protein
VKPVNKNPPSLNHGKSYVYTVHNCRCALCTEAWKLQMRKYRLLPGKLQAHAQRAVVKRYKQKYAGNPEALMVALVKYQYNPNYHARKTS